ncbi:MAG: RNA recognition motif domain-containing protein [Puniceicoccaceae bacterium]
MIPSIPSKQEASARRFHSHSNNQQISNRKHRRHLRVTGLPYLIFSIFRRGRGFPVSFFGLRTVPLMKSPWRVRKTPFPIRSFSIRRINRQGQQVDIYVGNLPYSIDGTELEQLFGEYGTVDRVYLISDRETGRPRGFGFVTMNNADEARAAIEALDGHEVGGRALKINEARPREEHGGGGGGGHGGGRGGRGGDRRGGR